MIDWNAHIRHRSCVTHLVGGRADALGNISVVADGDVGLLVQTHDLCSIVQQASAMDNDDTRKEPQVSAARPRIRTEHGTYLESSQCPRSAPRTQLRLPLLPTGEGFIVRQQTINTWCKHMLRSQRCRLAMAGGERGNPACAINK